MTENKPLVVITGASSGFGAEDAKLFNAAGYPLLLLGRRLEKIQALPLDFTNVMTAAVDVTDQAALADAIHAAEAQYGATDLLINNAGVMLLGNVQRQDPKEWQTMLKPFQVSLSLLKSFKAQNTSVCRHSPLSAQRR